MKTNQKNDPRFLNQSFFSSFDGRRHRCTIEIYPSVDIGPAYVVRQQQRTAPQQHLNKQKTIRDRSDVNPKSFGKDEKVNELEVTGLVRKTLFWGRLFEALLALTVG